MNKSLLFLCISVFFVSNNIFAQDRVLPSKKKYKLPPIAQNSSDNISEFIGIVQYAKGISKVVKQTEQRKKIKQKRELRFKSFFHRGDQIQISDDSYLKFITGDKCIGVIYGKGTFFTPKEKSNSHVWSVYNADVRWICSVGRTQAIELDGNIIHIEGAEIFYHDQELFVRRGVVRVNGRVLSANQSYKIKNSKWSLEKSRSKAYALWKLNDKQPMPAESMRSIKPKKEFTSRWVASFGGGGGGLTHSNNVFNMDYDISNGNKCGGTDCGDEGDGPPAVKFLGNFELFDRDFIMSLTFFEAQNNDQIDPMSCYSNSGSNPSVDCSRLFDRLDVANANIGLRFNKNQKWSYFSTVGLSVISHQTDGSSSSFRTEYIGVNTVLGVDYFLEFQSINWLGFYFSAEAIAAISLFKINSSEDQHSGPPCTPNCGPAPEDPVGTVMIIGAQFFLGPMIKF